nr:MAG: hypothetical protein [Botourmiaviridae sp.]
MPLMDGAGLPRLGSPGRDSDKPITGSDSTVRCTCKSYLRRTKETIALGLKLVRTRFALGRGELPELERGALDKYLLKLLDPSGPPLPFPRSQSGWDQDGFPRFKRLSRRDRWCLAQSIASIKRTLASNACSPHKPPSSFPSWSANACQESPPQPSPEYLAFCRKVVRREFPLGWDRGLYSSFCESYIPTNSCRAEKLNGLPYGSSEWWSTHSNRKEWLAATLRGRVPSSLPDNFQLRYKEVLTTGKMRPLGIPSLRFDLLAPLHKSIYQHLTKKSWLLRGSANRKRISATCVRRYQTSVDLVAATDGLSTITAEVILGALLAKSVEVPGYLKSEACRSLRPDVMKDGRSYGITHGQMMGSYLSFPLLCLQSYCAARWACRDDEGASILVNGDDTLISSSLSDVLARYPAGFNINRNKTKVSENVAEINSTTFLREQRKGWREVVNLRRGGGRRYVFEELRHVASACVKAGPKWQEAFIRSGALKGTNIDPVDLGLSRRVHDVWRLSTTVFRKGKRLRLPEEDVCKDGRLEAVDRRPGIDEQCALRELLFNEGRFEGVGARPPLTFLKGLQSFERKGSSLAGLALLRGMRTCLSYRPDVVETSAGRKIGGFVVKGWAPTTNGKPLETKEIEGDVYLVSNLWW